MDTVWLFVALVLWALQTIWEYGKPVLIGVPIGLAILLIVNSISNSSTERDQREERLQRKVDNLESEVTKIKRELDQISDRLGDIDRARRH